MTNMYPRPFRVIDILLIDVVQKIQLSRTDYDLAVARYSTIAEWLERDGSPLQGLVRRLYAQGSMAMRATISSKLENDEFDIDVMAELSAALHRYGPRWILDILFIAINGEPGSRYHGKVTRNTRCVTVDYENMHLDVTPAVLLAGMPRTSHIFHSKRELPASEDRCIVANPWGFAEWFMSVTPAAPGSLQTMLKAADAEPVPERPELFERSLPLMALQLLKRWRNKRYDQRDCRCPPSILMACLVGEHAGAMLEAGLVRSSLHDELVAQVGAMLQIFEQHQAAGWLVSRTNPACADDVITDRWPATLSDQKVLLKDLRDLASKLTMLGSNTGLDTKRTILSDLFGERVTNLAYEDYQGRLAASANTLGIVHAPRTGGILSGITPALIMPGVAGPAPAPRHTSFGGMPLERPWKS